MDNLSFIFLGECINKLNVIPLRSALLIPVLLLLAPEPSLTFWYFPKERTLVASRDDCSERHFSRPQFNPRRLI